MSDIDTDYTQYITCPYCGHKDRDSWEVDFGPGIEGDTTVECGSCSKEFFVSRHIEVTYFSRKIVNK